MAIGERSVDDELAVMRRTDLAECMGLLTAPGPSAARQAMVVARLKSSVAIQAYHARVVECWECLFTPAGDPCWRCTPFRGSL
jgi:hypothetical protein